MYRTLSILFIALLSGVRLTAQANVQHEIDSVAAQITVLEGQEKLNAYSDIYYLFQHTDQVEKQLSYIKEYMAYAKQQKNDKEESFAKAQHLLCLYNNDLKSDFFALLSQYLEFWAHHKMWEKYFFFCQCAVDGYISERRYETALREAQKTYNFAKKHELLEGVGSALLGMGRTYQVMDRYPEAEAALKEALPFLKSFYNKELAFEAYSWLGDVLKGQKKFTEILAMCKDWEALILEEEKDIVSGNHNMHKINMYLVLASAYIGLKQPGAAEAELRKAELLGSNMYETVKNQLRYERVQLHDLRGEYSQALLLLDTMYQAYVSTGLAESLLAVLNKRAHVATHAKDYKLATAAYEELFAATDSIRTSEITAQLNEIRTIYEVDKLTAEKERNRNYLIMAMFVCVLLVFTLAVWVIYSRRLNAKNKGLVRQILEQDRLTEELEKSQHELHQLRKLLGEKGAELADNEEDELFFRLKKLMQSHPYTNKELTRKVVAEQLGTNEKYLHEAIRKSLNMSFGEYITGLRLSYARELLLQQEDSYTMDAVAADSGLGSRSTLYRLFREQYGLSPEKFRELARQ